MNEDIIGRIERYLNDGFSIEERVAFENELLRDSELQKQVDFMKVLPSAIQIHSENLLRKQLKEIETKLPRNRFMENSNADTEPEIEPPVRKLYPFELSFAIAASVLLIVGIFAWVQSDNHLTKSRFISHSGGAVYSIKRIN